jgi:signal transduction histidine kinase
MTIKQRLIISNVILIVVPVVVFFILGNVARLIAISFYGIQGFNGPGPGDNSSTDQLPVFAAIFYGMLALMAAIIFINNWMVMKKIVRHITEEHEKYENSHKELIAGVSHDLRTPLTVIKAYLEGLETGVANTPEKQKKYMETIKAKTNDLEKIINRLFLFSKLDIGELPMNLQIIEADKFIQDLADDYAEEYKQKGILLEIKNLAKDPVKADVLWLHNVFINIFENSAKYKDKDMGKVIISSRRIKGINGKAMMEIHLEDNGPGVPPETLGRLFDIFYRVDSSRNSKGGSGLGLAISSRVLQYMGGSIRAESGESGGLDIVISFPIMIEK